VNDAQTGYPLGSASLLRRAAGSSVTEAYDRADDALRELEGLAPDLAAMVRTARDLLFAVRVTLENNE
jgi:hypothetical protein